MIKFRNRDHKLFHFKTDNEATLRSPSNRTVGQNSILNTRGIPQPMSNFLVTDMIAPAMIVSKDKLSRGFHELKIKKQRYNDVAG